MKIFVDTSALVAVANPSDLFAQAATRLWDEWKRAKPELISTNYVYVETAMIIQRRHGLAPVMSFRDMTRSLVKWIWIDRDLHETAFTHMGIARRRRVSLVDHVSFEVMRRMGISDAFTFDPHFADAGFTCVPGPTAPRPPE